MAAPRGRVTNYGPRKKKKTSSINFALGTKILAKNCTATINKIPERIIDIKFKLLG